MSGEVAILMTCFNRRELTLKSIAAVKAATRTPDRIRIFLTEDGCTDGTPQAVAQAHPDVTILHGDGQLYWNGGMRVAWQAALGHSFDFFLWLNDDLAMLPGSLDRLLETYSAEANDDPRLIVVGKTRSTDGKADTYGGRIREAGPSRLRFRPTGPVERFCDTMNGNCVLIPVRAVDEIGINSAAFRHSMGDMDYGLRARRAGYRIYEMPDPVGFLDGNLSSYSQPRRGGLQGLRQFMSDPKQMPVREWLYFCRQHGGWLWPANFVVMYARPAASLLKMRQS